MALVTKSDFISVVQFTENISDRILDFHISDAENFDFVPRVSAAFYAAVQISASPANEMTDFRENFVKPLIVCYAFQRYLLWAGRSVTQYGLVQIKEDTSDAITRQDRADLINDIKSKANVYLTRFYNELTAINYTIDGVVYSFDSTCESRKPVMKIRAVGGGVPKYYDRLTDRLY